MNSRQSTAGDALSLPSVFPQPYTCESVTLPANAQALVTDIVPDINVRNAMNEINASQRLRCCGQPHLHSLIAGDTSFRRNEDRPY